MINDRHAEFNDNNMSLCENECTFTGYDVETKKSKCECGIKNKEFVISELINQTDILSYNFTSKEKSSNMITMKCYYTLFTKNGLANNIGSYILIFITCFFISLGILFYKCGYPLLEEMIKEIINIKKQKAESQKIDNLNINLKTTVGNNKKIKNIKKSNTKTKKKLKMKKAKGKFKENIQFNKRDKYINNTTEINENSKNSFKFQSQNIVNIPNNSEKDNKILSNDLSFYFDYDLNTMAYKDALNYDKRTICTYYISLVKTKNYIIFAFWPNKDYNSTIIKIALLLIFFSIFYFINALFFDESTIHKIYEDEGFYNFIYLVPHIFCSFAISHTINTVIKYIFFPKEIFMK